MSWSILIIYHPAFWTCWWAHFQFLEYFWKFLWILCWSTYNSETLKLSGAIKIGARWEVAQIIDLKFQLPFYSESHLKFSILDMDYRPSDYIWFWAFDWFNFTNKIGLFRNPASWLGADILRCLYHLNIQALYSEIGLYTSCMKSRFHFALWPSPYPKRKFVIKHSY